MIKPTITQAAEQAAIREAEEAGKAVSDYCTGHFVQNLIAETEAERDRLAAEVERLKTRVTVTEWSQPGEQKLVLRGTPEETRELAWEHFGVEQTQILTPRKRSITNAELETLPEWQS